MLDINLEFAKGMLFIRLDGILNSETVEKLNEILDDMINNKGLKYFAINLEKTLYVSNKVFQTIIDRNMDLIKKDGKIIICDNNLFNNSFNMIEHTNSELNALKLINI